MFGIIVIVAGLRIGGEKRTFDDHLLVIGDAAGTRSYVHCI